jgi:hypothetical protein
MSVINFRAERAKRLRHLLETAYHGDLTDDGLSEAAAWRKERERRRLEAEIRWKHDKSFHGK